MTKKAFKTPEDYLASLPEDRREIIAAVRKLILRHLPRGYRESVSCGMLSYEIPLERFPITYNKQSLMYAALASQKNHCAIYLMCVYAAAEPNRKLREAFAKAGKKLDMGKSCVRFKKLDDLALDAIAAAIASMPVDKYIECYEKSRTPAGRGKC